MSQATSASAKVGYISETMTQLVTPGSGGYLDSMHRSLNMGDQNIGVLQQTLTGLYNVVVTLDQKCIICLRMVQLSLSMEVQLVPQGMILKSRFSH